MQISTLLLLPSGRCHHKGMRNVNTSNSCTVLKYKIYKMATVMMLTHLWLKFSEISLFTLCVCVVFVCLCVCGECVCVVRVRVFVVRVCVCVVCVCVWCVCVGVGVGRV